MYCPKCTQHYRKRSGRIRICICGYPFVFGHYDVIKDRLMLFLERKASKNETRYFTINNLYAVYEKHQIKHRQSKYSKSYFSNKYDIWQKQSILKSHKFYEKKIHCPKCAQYFYKKKQDTIDNCSCGYQFIFKQNDVIKDRFIWFLEKKASKNGTSYFTMDILYAIYQKYHTKSQLSQKHFAQKYQFWQKHSSLRSEKFIDKPSLEQPENPIGEEVFDYGIESIIVVDQPLKVDLFVKNNKHINKKALIISSDGYPAYLKPQLQKILAKQANVPVSFLYQDNRTIDEEKTRFEQNYQVKLESGQVRDISVNQNSARRLMPLKVDPKITGLKSNKFYSTANKSNSIKRIISVGIKLIIISAVIGIVIFYPYHKSEPPESRLSDNNSNQIPVFTDINSKPSCYKLIVNAMPLVSRIRIMNIKPKYKSGICLKQGDYDIYVTHKNYQSYRRWIKIEDSDVSISVTLDSK